MEVIDITNLVIPKPVLSFNFRTLMLFRCTKRKYAQDFISGKIFFNTPRNWIKEEEKGNKGQGDCLEGTFFSAKSNDTHPFIAGLKSDANLTHFDNEGYTFFRRRNIENLPCVCFYGLNDNDWNKVVDKQGKGHWKTVVPLTYFSDFSGGLTREEYERIEVDEQPVIMLIRNPHSFFEKIRKALYKLGVLPNEIIISPVDYLEKHTVAMCALEYPRELLIKDISFAAQKEIRIIINTQSKSFYKYFVAHSGVIDVGSLCDFIDIQDYYFSDMEIERIGNKKISYTLPKPFVTVCNWDSLTFMDLFQKYREIQWQYPNDIVEREKKLSPLIDYIKKRFGIKLFSDGAGYKIEEITPGASKAVFNEIEKYSSKIDSFYQQIDELLKGKHYDEAIAECRKARENKELASFSYKKEREIYLSLNREAQFLNFCDYCLENDLVPFDTLTSRFLFYVKKGMYKEALSDLQSVQDIIGYNFDVSFNKGICLIHLGDYHGAIDIFTRMLNNHPNDGSLYYNRGIAYYKLHNSAAAIADVQKAIELDPNNDFYKQEFQKMK